MLVRLWLPVGFFLVLALFPFYWMAITSLKPNAELYNRNVMPLIVHAPTLKHYVDLLTKTSFLLWTWNTMLIAIVSTAISLILGTMLAYPLARMRFAGAGLIAMTVAAVYLVPQPLLFIPLADVINSTGSRQYADIRNSHLPHNAGSFCAWLLLGYFKTVPKELEEAAQDRWCQPDADGIADISPVVHAWFHFRRHLRLHVVAKRISLRADLLTKTTVRTVPVGVIAELIRGDVFYWGQLMAGGIARVDPSCAHLLVLRRALRCWPYWVN